jgi:large subunit ribosomal protein L22
MPETRATVRYLPTSPYKVREVLGLIRGLDVEAARRVLQFCEREAATDVLKLVDSVIANAEHNDSLPSDELFIARAWADEGPTQKRWRPRARGRGTRIRKRTSHVTVVVARYSDEELQRRSEREVMAEASGRRTRTPIRRRRRVAVEEHDHDHDHDDAVVETVAGSAATIDAAVEPAEAVTEESTEATATEAIAEGEAEHTAADESGEEK